MSTVLDILPSEIYELIYRSLFNICLQDIKEGAFKKQISIISNYSCELCCISTIYPEKYKDNCESCNKIMCSTCRFISYHFAIAKCRTEMKKYCKPCIKKNIPN